MELYPLLPSLQYWLPEGRPAHFVVKIVEQPYLRSLKALLGVPNHVIEKSRHFSDIDFIYYRVSPVLNARAVMLTRTDVVLTIEVAVTTIDAVE